MTTPTLMTSTVVMSAHRERRVGGVEGGLISYWVGDCMMTLLHSQHLRTHAPVVEAICSRCASKPEPRLKP